MPDLGWGMWRARSSPARKSAPAEPAIRARRGDAMLCDGWRLPVQRLPWTAAPRNLLLLHNIRKICSEYSFNAFVYNENLGHPHPNFFKLPLSVFESSFIFRKNGS